ncbi:MAG: hypothetical protein LBJ48_00105 [Coriobacteriales bacterium]|jgi:hypothetical protein|nr:hypothetical protein [Coriobacteriales bacterium]
MTGWLNRNFPGIANKIGYCKRVFQPRSGTLGATQGVHMDYYGNIPADADEEDIYATEDGYMEVAFWYHRLGEGNWRVYILSDINYHGRDSGSHPSHRYHDSTLNMHYICYDQTIRTKAEAKNVSADWADLTAHYIQTGTPF